THILSDAEALCDRVAIIHLGELRGVGSVVELTASIHSKVEIVWQGVVEPAALKTLGAECHTAGDTTRAVIDEENQDAALEALRRERLRLISVTPVRMSLEDYFMTQLTDKAGSNAHVQEGSDGQIVRTTGTQTQAYP